MDSCTGLWPRREENGGGCFVKCLCGRNRRDCHPLIVVVIASHNGESLPSGSWDQSAKGDDSALESHSPGLAFPVGNLKLGLRELNSG